MSFKAEFKGWRGEMMLTLAKKLFLSGNAYHDLNNVTILTSNGTTQIDHIIVSRYGIFVIETKNMEGWIFGSEKQSKWVQSLYGKKFPFQNPLHQNYRHIKSLEEFLDLPAERFHSIVCFVGKTSKLKTEMPDNVINGLPFTYIKSKKEIVMSDDQVLAIVKSIQSRMLPKTLLGLSTRETKRKHLASLEERHGRDI